MRIGSIASGSSGNSIYVGSDTTHLLVDAGVSNKRIEQGLEEFQLSAADVGALLITHEHSDHIQGLRVFLKKHPCPVYASEGTIRRIIPTLNGEVPKELFRVVRAGQQFTVGDMRIRPFSIDHDAAEPLAFRLESGEKAAAVATDMGHYTEEIVGMLEGLDALLVESNHDIRMLEAGPYPYALKRRILGNFGHLSNESAGRLVARILHDDLKKIILGHLSKENNFPELAYETVRCEISEASCPYQPDDFRIEVAARDRVSALTEF